MKTVNHSNHNSCCFLFQRALVVADETPVQLRSAAVLYNLALSQHLVGVLEGATRKVVAAKRLYLLALDLVKRHSQENGSRQALLVSLCIANNLGETYLQELQDHKEANKCFSFAREILARVSASESFASAGDEAEDEYGFFYLNAMVRSTGSTIATPAA